MILMILVHLNKTNQKKKTTVRIGSGAKTQYCIVAGEGGKLGNKAGFRPLQQSLCTRRGFNHKSVILDLPAYAMRASYCRAP